MYALRMCCLIALFVPMLYFPAAAQKYYSSYYNPYYYYTYPYYYNYGSNGGSTSDNAYYNFDPSTGGWKFKSSDDSAYNYNPYSWYYPSYYAYGRKK
uniref:Uncharacterized protein n=1 Tax=Globodera rostochiensis TaxID=31243 RepID=A0A914IF32_GLORO